MGSSIVSPKFSFSAIRIDSVKSTISTCPNNGSITVYASTNTPAILYSIIAGPVTQPVQTGNFFNSLPPGNYTIKVSNAALETATQDITIEGNYILPELNPIIVSPYCAGGNDGHIIGNLTTGTGKGPYSWQLIAPSPITSLPQANDTFNNLVAGNYTVRVTDACGSFRTIVATITDPITFFTFQFVPYFEITGCDTALVTLYLKFSDNKPAMPLSYKYETKNGTYIPMPGSESIDSSQFPGYIMIQQMIPHITYGDTVITTIYNACGDSLTYNSIIDPYDFHPLYSFDSCGRLAHVDFNYITDPYIFYGLKAPVNFTLTDSATNVLIDSATITGDSLHHYYNMITGIAITPNVITGNTYTLTVADGCGKFFQKNYLIPAPALPVILSIDLLQPACIDSIVGLVRIQVTGFSNPKIVLLSGPATLGSTKPGFAYTDTYTYPDTVLVGFGGEYFFLNNLAAGTYQFKVIDDCGNDLPGSFSVDRSSLTSLGKAVRYEKGCLGQNKIFFTKRHGDTLNYLNQNGAATIKTTNLTSSTVLKDQRYYGNLVSDSILNVPSGTYEISFGFEQSGYGTYVNDSIHSCLTLKDTIFIESYQTPVITSSNSILCHNAINVQVIPDSSKGIPPYQYEIIAGPQIFPVQNSNVFTVNTAGTYTARIYDICGNASTASITADTLSFPPIAPLQPSCNSIQLFLGASTYYTYTWTNPSSQIYTGDTLVIDPVTAADTGIYHIARMVDINGCKDTFNTTYHLNFPLTYKLLKTVCNGDSIHIGNHAYSSTGVFSDTLISSKGCDSIVVLDLTVLPLKKDSVVKNICTGQSVTIGTHTYNQAGIYRDTISTAACDSIVILNLRVDPIRKDSLVKKYLRRTKHYCWVTYLQPGRYLSGYFINCHLRQYCSFEFKN
ncbi:MAG: hypothetical protein IPP72_14880 [Chitinophagaceae bacterium]|nr:hypothetical protein [Chitinophagaceae bacterium]